MHEQWRNMSLLVSLIISLYIMGGSSEAKRSVRNVRYHPCPAIDLARDTRVIVLSHPDTPCTIRHGLRYIFVAPDGRILSYHSRFLYEYILCVQRDIATVQPMKIRTLVIMSLIFL